MLKCVSVPHSFLRLNNMPLCVSRFAYPFIHWWVLGLLPCLSYCKYSALSTLWTQVSEYFFETLLSVLFGIYPEVERLNHIILCLIFLKNLHNISTAAVPFYTPTVMHKRFKFLVVFLIGAILVGVTWYVIVVLVCISLLIGDVGYLFMCLLVICIFSWRNVFMSFAHFWISLFFVVEF